MERLVVSYRGLGLNENGFSSTFDLSLTRPPSTAVMVEREGAAPTISRMRHGTWTLPPLSVWFEGAAENLEAARRQIFTTFDTNEALGALVIADPDGSNERYVMAACLSIQQEPDTRGLGFTATLVVSDEHAWLAVTAESETLSATDTGDEIVINNSGEMDAYPTYRITPTDFKDGNDHWQYKQFVAVLWRSPYEAFDYPICITGSGLDTAALINDGKAGSNERSLGVLVDGIEVDRWYGNPPGVSSGYNSTSTKVWINLDFGPVRQAALDDVIGTGDITEIQCSTDISQFPDQGILCDPGDLELFIYDGKDNDNKKFLNVKRAQYGTSAVTHLDSLVLVQHEVWIVYTPGINVAKVQDNSKQPMISLAESSNTQWKWDGEFGSSSRPNRTAAWKPVTTGLGLTYTGVFKTTPTDPFTVLGVEFSGGSADVASWARWQVYLPCGFSSYDLNGFSSLDATSSGIYLYASTDGAEWEEINNTVTQDDGTTGWGSWNLLESGLDNTTFRYLAIGTSRENLIVREEMNSALIGLMSSIGGGTGYTPDVQFPEEMTNYPLDIRITNTTTGEWIELEYPLMELDETLEVDTAARTVTYLKNNTNQYQALTRSSIRRHMLKLRKGSNTLEVEEAGLAGLDLEVEFRPRYYT